VNAPANRTHEHARQWVADGHEVTVITGVPNHPTGVLFPGYANRSVQEERVDGIRVIRTWMYLTANEGFARRTLNYFGNFNGNYQDQCSNYDIRDVKQYLSKEIRNLRKAENICRRKQEDDNQEPLYKAADESARV